MCCVAFCFVFFGGEMNGWLEGWEALQEAMQRCLQSDDGVLERATYWRDTLNRTWWLGSTTFAIGSGILEAWTELPTVELKAAKCFERCRKRRGRSFHSSRTVSWRDAGRYYEKAIVRCGCLVVCRAVKVLMTALKRACPPWSWEKRGSYVCSFAETMGPIEERREAAPKHPTGHQGQGTWDHSSSSMGQRAHPYQLC